MLNLYFFVSENNVQNSAVHRVPSTTNMASKKNWRYASRSPVRSKDKRDPTDSKITPWRELKDQIVLFAKGQVRDTKNDISCIVNKMI